MPLRNAWRQPTEAAQADTGVQINGSMGDRQVYWPRAQDLSTLELKGSWDSWCYGGVLRASVLAQQLGPGTAQPKDRRDPGRGHVHFGMRLLTVQISPQPTLLPTGHHAFWPRSSFPKPTIHGWPNSRSGAWQEGGGKV